MVLFAEEPQLEVSWQMFAYYESNLILARFLASAIKKTDEEEAPKVKQVEQLNVGINEWVGSDRFYKAFFGLVNKTCAHT